MEQTDGTAGDSLNRPAASDRAGAARGLTSDAVRAMEYVIDQRVRVSNNSWGGGPYSQALYDVIEASQSIGHIFVVAAGNGSADMDVEPYYPAAMDLPNIIAVAATDNDDALGVFWDGSTSNYGATTVDLGAPGISVYSTILMGLYGFSDGTSMAAPHVTGVAALVMTRYPGLGFADVKDVILTSARPVDSLKYITVTEGVLNAFGAVTDCNRNGVLDDQDISEGFSADCDFNGIPDECDPDCNGNESPDACDISAGTSDDCNGNGIPDECLEYETDCNGNSTPDACDIAGGASEDCNANGIPDECIADEQDCNGNLVPDACDISGGVSLDDNGNGRPDECEPPILYVDADATGNDSGTSWANAFNELQDALVVARLSLGRVEEVWVAEGTYKPDRGTHSRNLAFDLVNGLELFGGFAGGESSREQRDPAANVTVLSGDLLSDDTPDFENYADNSFHVVTAVDTDATTLIDGFTVYGAARKIDSQATDNGSGMVVAGGSPTITNCLFAGNTGYSGGGMAIRSGASPNLTNCQFTGNQAGEGGGLYISGGSPTFTECVFRENSAVPVSLLLGRCGGGLYIKDGDPSFTGCTFVGNFAYHGGGMFNDGGAPTFADCAFIDNMAEVPSLNSYAEGGGIHTTAGNPTFDTCTFEGNWTPSGRGGCMYIADGGAMLTNCTFAGNSVNENLSDGGGLYVREGDATVTGCTFQGNYAARNGGGVYSWTGSSPILSDCVLDENVAGEGGGGLYNYSSGALSVVNCSFRMNSASEGGGLVDYRGSASLTNCVFNDNMATTQGGGLFTDQSISSLANGTLVGNSAPSGSAIACGNSGVRSVGSTVEIRNAIIRNGGDEISNNDGSTITVMYSNIEGGWAGEGNIDEDPRFVDADGADNLIGTADDDLRLRGGSPCIDAGDNDAVPADVADLDDDGDTGEPVPFDMDGRPRFVDDPATDPDPGAGDPPVVDMGAFEYQEDCNENGILDSVDIAEGTSQDCTGNGIPDECEPDCNDTGTPDSCDIADGISEDCNVDGVPDECQPDCDEDGTPDACELPPFGDGNDCNENQVPDECDVALATSHDCDGDNVPDECQPDCDDDGTPDACELPPLGESEDCNENGIPDECDIAGISWDCNENGVPDECDVADGTSADCNGNVRPDECDIADGAPDCTGNGILDQCEPDCNGNWVADSCDIQDGTSEDGDGDGIPDECENAPAAEPGGAQCVVDSDCTGAWMGADCVGGICYVPKNRYLSIDPTTNEYEVAYQVEITEAAEYPTAIGRTWWLGEPVCYDYPNGDPLIPAPATCEGAERFGWVSDLSAVAVTRVWNEIPVHIAGCGVAPAVIYAIRASTDHGSTFSDPLEIRTAHNPEGPSQSWGDITGGPVEGMPGLWLAPDGSTNFADVGNAIRTFENRVEDTGFPPRVWVDLEINQVINLGDVSFVIMAFEGRPYADIQLPLIGVHPADCP